MPACGFDRLAPPWLTLLAAALPVLVVPMATEAVARRRGRTARRVPAWCWLPPALVAVACTLAGIGVAPLLGLARNAHSALEASRVTLARRCRPRGTAGRR